MITFIVLAAIFGVGCALLAVACVLAGSEHWEEDMKTREYTRKSLLQVLRC